MNKLLLVGFGLGLAVFSAYGNSHDQQADYESQILKSHNHSVYTIMDPQRVRGGGTGFAIEGRSGEKYIVTNGHVCALAVDGKMAAIEDDGDSYIINVLKISDETDLCMLSGIANSTALKPASFVSQYERLFILGHPKLRKLTVASGFFVSTEMVKTINLEVPDALCIGIKYHLHVFNTPFGPIKACVMSVPGVETNIIIYGGNSGSPVLTKDGLVAGVAFAGDNETSHGFFIPLSALMQFLYNF